MKNNFSRIGFLLALFAVLVTSCKVFDKEKVSTAPNEWQAATSEKKEYNFPEDWLGRWFGNLDIYDHSGLKQSLPMMAINLPTENPDVYSWALVYGEDTIAGKRDYLLNVVDAEKGMYQVDEQNGIFLDGYHIHDEFISVFEVMGNTLTSSYRIVGDKMEFKIMMYNSNPNNITGDTIIAGEEVPEVKNYPVKVAQKALLTRM